MWHAICKQRQSRDVAKNAGNSVFLNHSQSTKVNHINMFYGYSIVGLNIF